MKISVIVPFYNAQKTLPKCVQSITAQSYKNLQIILIDDGSTDNGAKIAQNLAIKDSRILVISQKNSGVSAARNSALNAADGEYIAFVDSDDILGASYFKDILAFNEMGADLIIYPFFMQDKNGDFIPTRSASFVATYLSDQNAILRWFSSARGEQEHLININSVASKIYRKELIKDIRFDESFKMGEDYLFFLNALNSANSALIINEPMSYFYSFSANGLSKNIKNDIKRRENIFEIVNRTNKFFISHNLALKSAHRFASACFIGQIFGICLINDLGIKVKTSLLKNLRRHFKLKYLFYCGLKPVKLYRVVAIWLYFVRAYRLILWLAKAFKIAKLA